MARSKEYELAIKISGEIEKSFDSTMKGAKKELQDLARYTSETMSETLPKGLKDASSAFDGIESAGREAFQAMATAATAAGTAMAGVAAASISVGSSFESAFAGVKKTTDATTLQYEELKEGILELSKSGRVIASADEIAEVAEAAGQLGIEKEYLLEFSEVMIQMGDSTNLAAAEAASELAKFANITNMAATEYSNLGSVIVALGNNFATTEADIVAMATRLAASGDLVGLSQAQIMALSTAMSSVGIEAEAGGSAMSKLLKKVQMAVELGGKSLNKYASVAGMTAKEFQTAFGEDALAAVSAFISGLNDTERNGKSAIAILDDMGLTEVRLSNTILSLANANGVLTNAVTMANDAWEENVALANEAAQRYETTESKVEILKNKVSGIGIEIYDDLREPYREIINLTSDMVTELDEMLDGNNVISDMAENFTKNLPTAVRKVKEFGTAVADFSEPFLKVGDWLVDNPGIISGGITAVGTALGTYKIASGITSMAAALGTLGPVGTGILALGGVAGVITGIGTAVKKSANEAKKANLAAHFGDISLSLEELEEAAGYIVSNDSLGKVREAMSVFDDLEEMQRAMDASLAAINKMNWKVSIGMELSESDQEQYISEMSDYVERCQQYLQDEQYAVSMAVGVLTDADVPFEQSNILTEVTNFYASKQQELSELGTKLNQTITDAFQDGLLDIDEVAEITKLQQQMAKIQSAVAGSNFDANLELLKLKFEGGDLDPEAFQNLQAEIQEQLNTAIADYDEAYTLSVANAKIMLEDGAIEEAEYQQMIEEFRENYLQQVGELQEKAANFQIDTMMSQYQEELDAAIPELQAAYSEFLSKAFSEEELASWKNNPVGMWTWLEQELVDVGTLDSTTKAALQELLEQMQPTQEQMKALAQQYRDAGQEIPDNLRKGLTDIATLEALVGDCDGVWTLIGESVVNNEAYMETVNMLRENGSFIPETVGQAIEDNKEVVDTAVQELYQSTDSYLQNQFAKGFDVYTAVRFNMDTTIDTYNPYAYVEEMKESGVPHAEGGIFNTPHYGVFAEDGPEAFIPIDGSKRAIDLWEQTGKLLGVNSTYNSYWFLNEKEEVPMYAEGGIFNTPHYGIFAEEGPEALIPIDGSKRAIDLWEQTGKLLGVNGVGQESGFSALADSIAEPAQKSTVSSEREESGVKYGEIIYSPNIQFYGTAPDRNELDEALEISLEKFEELMEQYIKSNRRLNFL